METQAIERARTGITTSDKDISADPMVVLVAFSSFTSRHDVSPSTHPLKAII